MNHRPARGSDVEQWLKARRDDFKPLNYLEQPDNYYYAVDHLLDEYRLAADTGKGLLDETQGL